jgi:hypothetical protein
LEKLNVSAITWHIYIKKGIFIVRMRIFSLPAVRFESKIPYQLELLPAIPVVPATSRKMNDKSAFVRKFFNPYLVMSLNHENAIGLHIRENG